MKLFFNVKQWRKKNVYVAFIKILSLNYIIKKYTSKAEKYVNKHHSDAELRRC